MADENQAQGPGQEQEQPQETEPAQEPAEKQQKDKPAKEKKGGGLLLPILYALLAAVGAFTLVMIIGIVVTFVTRPDQPQESPSEEPSFQSTVEPVQARQSPDGDDFHTDAALKGVTAFFV